MSAAPVPSPAAPRRGARSSARGGLGARSGLVGVVALVALLGAGPAAAAVPTTLLFEGVLLGAGGGPVSDGPYKLSFALYDVDKGGTALWSEGPSDVAVSAGAFAAVLGATSALDASKLDGKRFLGVTVAGEPELPRVALHSSAFAARAAVADGLSCTGCVSIAALKFDGDLDLGGNSVKAKNITATGDVVAKTVTAATFVGDGSKLTGIALPTGSCKTGTFVTGIAPDGKLLCAAGGGAAGAVLGGKLTDTLAETASPDGLPKPIPDNTGIEATAIIAFGDVGVADTVTVHLKMSNSDLVKGLTLCDPCGGNGEKAFDKVFDSKSVLKSGALADYDNKPLKGTWTLKVLDAAFCIPQAPGNKELCDVNAGTDGQILAFSVSGTVASSQSVRTTGTFQFGLFDAAPFPCAQSKKGHAFFETSSGQLHLCDGTAWREVMTASLCGNKVVNGGETCDDGNQTDTDACTNACKKNVCGDGVVFAGVEECDDGNSDDGDACSNSCKSAFKAVTFTNCNQSGRDGPSQNSCNTAYANTPLAGKVTVNAGVQKWVVPHTGSYVIETFGAQGGDAPGFAGGKGARMKGTFALKLGDVLWIVVGQAGSNSQSAGGGGGSFVGIGDALATAKPLIVAGGGGGGRSSSYVGVGRPGNTTTSGSAGRYPGGTNGNGGERQNGPSGGFAGGGFYTDGMQGGAVGKSGFAFVHGAGGGIRQDNGANLCADGGFGGGGGGMHNSNQGSGGGGGYSGGGAGHDSVGPGYGGGGGSYNGGADASNSEGVHSGHGKISISAG
jgi:cysteine-rich repeat protein